MASDDKKVVRLSTTHPCMSQIVIRGDMVYLSGQTYPSAIDEREPIPNELSPNSVTGQATAILERIDGLLAAAGTNKSHLLTANVWLKDIKTGLADFNAVWSKWLDPANKPVRATVQADLCTEEMLVEVQVSAELPPSA